MLANAAVDFRKWRRDEWIMKIKIRAVMDEE
jgi:hypothetical protein